MSETTGVPWGGYDVATVAVLTLVAFAMGVLAHFGLWKPTGVAGKAQDSLRTAGPQGL
ncbi:hypothetical protein OG883_26030 [Streptomyces sp. NBC_01142]|uniref:hypothetical protein n=1 Tax=Streptomyces sp. NBC_01142 TaxID=2975865 RepID=UPI0022578470|nr:hypothetical protein [Streptomyces sp. NBC_01142]MCX4823283.1 hypothetical protein [Streptomyces sp. NBC_01142]